MKYTAVKGSHISNQQAQDYGEYLEKLTVQYDGALTRDIVVSEAKPGTPIHDFFEWDDKIASHKYRLEQARKMMQSIEVEIKTNGDQEKIRAFHHVKIMKEHSYVTAARMMTEEELTQQVIDQALRELISFKKKYKQYTRLTNVFSAIDELQMEYQPA